MALKAERTRFEAEREALLPKLEKVKAELAELNRIRYWTRKVIPDALPRMTDGRVSVEDAMETAVNRKELEQVEDEAEQMAARQPQEQKKTQEKQKVKQQGEIVPLKKNIPKTRAEYRLSHAGGIQLFSFGQIKMSRYFNEKTDKT